MCTFWWPFIKSSECVFSCPIGSLLALYVIIFIIIILDIQLLLMFYIILLYSCVHTSTCILLIVFYIQRYNSQVQAGNSLCNYRGGLDMYMFCWPCIKSSKSCLCLYWWGCSLCALLPPALGGGGAIQNTSTTVVQLSILNICCHSLKVQSVAMYFVTDDLFINIILNRKKSRNLAAILT